MTTLSELHDLLEKAAPAILANGPPTDPESDCAGFPAGTPVEVMYGSNAALTHLEVAAVNALPALLEVAEAAREWRAGLRRVYSGLDDKDLLWALRDNTYEGILLRALAVLDSPNVKEGK